MSYFKSSTSELISELGNICLEELMLSSDAYICMIKFNMQGYKRLHRRLSKKFHNLYLDLQNESIEKYGTPLSKFENFTTYKPSSIKEHLTKWTDTLKEHYSKVGVIVKEIFEQDGYICEKGQYLQRILYKNIIKNERAIQKFEDCGWSMDVVYEHDHYLHKKMKHKEECERAME